MRDKISIIIIDKAKNHSDDIDKIQSDVIRRFANNSYEIYCFQSDGELIPFLNEKRGIDVFITVGKDSEYPILYRMPISLRKKWLNIEKYDLEKINAYIMDIFINGIGRQNNGMFSIFTCGYKTSQKNVEQLWDSIKSQTYSNWDWWILDDNPEGYDISYYERIKDPRVHIIKNVTNHGNIGFNKHLIAMCCDGEYLVELDHDDELLPNCLERLKEAFDTYPDSDFVYSDVFEEANGQSVYYDEGFALGYGYYKPYMIKGEMKDVAVTPYVNAKTVRHIVGLPNHVRCWKKEFYHRIGGHDTSLSVMDDMDLLIRTFLYGQMTKVDDVLYVQHVGIKGGGSGREGTTQAKRFGEIVRMGVFLKQRYDIAIHKRLLELGVGDPYWNEEGGYSDLPDEKREGTVTLNHVLF